MYLKHYAVCDYIYISVEWLSELAFVDGSVVLP